MVANFAAILNDEAKIFVEIGRIYTDYAQGRCQD